MAYKQYKFISDRAGVHKSGIRVPTLSGSGEYPPGRKLPSANSWALFGGKHTREATQWVFWGPCFAVL